MLLTYPGFDQASLDCDQRQERSFLYQMAIFSSAVRFQIVVRLKDGCVESSWQQLHSYEMG